MYEKKRRCRFFCFSFVITLLYYAFDLNNSSANFVKVSLIPAHYVTMHQMRYRERSRIGNNKTKVANKSWILFTLFGKMSVASGETHAPRTIIFRTLTSATFQLFYIWIFSLCSEEKFFKSFSYGIRREMEKKKNRQSERKKNQQRSQLTDK